MMSAISTECHFRAVSDMGLHGGSDVDSPLSKSSAFSRRLIRPMQQRFCDRP
jgi:hypothetical protein